MNKMRVESFTDAVIAIIMTIMVLEIKAPNVGTIVGLSQDIPYFLAYIVSFIFICIAWYNHHYVFSLIIWFSKRAFWANNLWLFTMSLIPVATAWVSKFWWMKAPIYFYLVVYTMWDLAYYLLTYILYQENISKDTRKMQKLKQSRSYRKSNRYLHIILLFIGYIGTYFSSTIGIVVILLETVIWYLNIPKNSDKIWINSNDD